MDCVSGLSKNGNFSPLLVELTQLYGPLTANDRKGKLANFHLPLTAL
jgi:hypothetical protein